MASVVHARAATLLRDALDQVERPPSVIILRMRHVPHIDATGLNALRDFHGRCLRHGTRLLLGGVHAHPLFEMTRIGFLDVLGAGSVFESLDEALVQARHLTNEPHPH